MPVKQPRREDKFIEIFLSVYENNSWKDADVIPLERIKDKSVEVLATRKSDGLTLAIEHTIIEPFLGEKGDLAQFWPAFEKLQEDPSFLVPDRITYVFVPVGILDSQKASSRQAIVQSVSAWLKANIAKLPEGRSKQRCSAAIPNKPDIEFILNFDVKPSPNFTSFKIARQQISVDLDKVVEKALRNKLPKLVEEKAKRRVLMLEREHMNSTGEQILAEVEKLRPSFPDLEKVDEIWIAETIFYDRDGAIFFFRYDSDGGTEAEIGFWDGKVQIQWDHTSPYGIPE